MTSSLRAMSLKIPCATSLNWMRTSTFDSFKAETEERSERPRALVYAEGRIQTFASLEDEWDTLPSWIVDPDGGSSERGTNGVGGNGIVLEISRFAVCRNVLAEKSIGTLNGWDGPQYFYLVKEVRSEIFDDARITDLLVTDVFSCEGNRSFHSQHAQNLQQI
jgi:hypothetical protein